MTGDELKKLRTKSGFTQKTLAEKLDIKRETVGRWESTGKISKVYQKMLNKLFKIK